MIKYAKLYKEKIKKKQYKPTLLGVFPFLIAFNFESSSNTIVQIAK